MKNLSISLTVLLLLILSACTTRHEIPMEEAVDPHTGAEARQLPEDICYKDGVPVIFHLGHERLDGSTAEEELSYMDTRGRMVLWIRSQKIIYIGKGVCNG